LVCSTDAPTPHKESSMLEVEKVGLGLDSRFKCLYTFIKRGMKKCSTTLKNKIPPTYSMTQ
jgi:hypothetical protein